MAAESKQISTLIDRSAADVYRYAFVARNEFGVLDHEVTLPSGDVIYNPMRVIPYGDACEVVFTLRRQPDMSNEDFERDAGLVQADLNRLKQLLEAAQWRCAQRILSRSLTSPSSMSPVCSNPYRS
jgi:hypothetical protein